MAPAKKNQKSKIVLTTISPKSTSTPAGMKFRPTTETTRETAKGKLPCAEATSVQQVIMMMFVHVCRKVLYGFDVSYRIGFYILGTLLISVVSDYKSTPVSRAYFANSNNFLNQWFVKLGWGWTLLSVGAFNYMAVRAYSCGRQSIMRSNLSRLVIASAAWFTAIYTFQMIENRTGVCELLKYNSRELCVSHGYLWKGFDISGHCFLLIFCNLFMIEEGKAYLGWERIKDYLRMEEHKRVNDTKETGDTPLSKLKNEEFLHLRKHYPLSTPYVRILFCWMAVLSILWDFMFLVTLLYFHLMIEKVVASGLAVLLWFSLYKGLYQHDLSPGLPGEGIFKYVTWIDPSLKKPAKHTHRHTANPNKWSAQDDVPKFMGMPLYALKDYKEEVVPEDLSRDLPQSMSARRGSIAGGRQGSISDLAFVRPVGRARSRSQSRTRLSSSKNSLNIKFS